MAKTLKVLLLVLLMLIVLNEAATPLFLQAITSALGTIPFTGGPMSTGLVGAKLGIGTKLLYYLGYFGRRSKPKSKSSSKTPKKIPSSGKGSSNLQPLPLPYMLSGGGQSMSNFQSSGMASGGIDPVQLFQALTAQGVDPNVAMSALNYAGGMGSNGQFPPYGFNPGFGMNTGEMNSGFGMNTGGMSAGGMNPGFGMNTGGMSAGGMNPEFGMNTGMNPGFGMNTGFANTNPAFASNANAGFSKPNKGAPFLQLSNVQQTPEENEDSEGEAGDLESFFSFLQDMDENTCISRLICDIGNDPSFLGEFSENIHSMVSSLSVRQSSQAYPYMEIMQNAASGPCQEKFPECDDSSYEVVKSVAPSVDLPTGVDSASINKL